MRAVSNDATSSNDRDRNWAGTGALGGLCVVAGAGWNGIRYIKDRPTWWTVHTHGQRHTAEPRGNSKEPTGNRPTLGRGAFNIEQRTVKSGPEESGSAFGVRPE